MIRRTLSLSLLVGIVLWLVLSYLSPSLIVLPQFSIIADGSGTLLQVLAVGTLILFVGVQLVLVHATVRMFRNASSERRDLLRAFGLRFWPEVVLTAIPLVMILGLALASYERWAAGLHLP